ncbi:MAG: porin family protein [Psychrosphaera sp.]|nr:porin family protein [Psychrosphaera sp.]
MKKSLLAAFILAICPLCQAADNSSEGKTHTLGYGAGWGSIKSDTFYRDSEDHDHDLYYYNYRLNENWSVNVERIQGDSDGGFLDINLFPLGLDDYDRVNYKAYAVSLKGAVNMSNRWSFYGKLGGHLYKTEFTDRVNTNYDDDGFDINAALGFEFRAYNGFGIGFEVGHIKMGDTQANTQGIYLSYAF